MIVTYQIIATHLLLIIISNQVSAINWEQVVWNQFTESPSRIPTSAPSPSPSLRPTLSPSGSPTFLPTATTSPSKRPTLLPTNLPTLQPSEKPSSDPSNIPTTPPTLNPSESPTLSPSSLPTNVPSEQPSQAPIKIPSDFPSRVPSLHPSSSPTVSSSPSEVNLPSSFPSLVATKYPSSTPSLVPTAILSVERTGDPSGSPSNLSSVSTIARTMGTNANGSVQPSTTSPSLQISSSPSLIKRRDISFEFLMELPAENTMGETEIESFELNAYNLVTTGCSLPSSIDIDLIDVYDQKFSLEGSTLLVQFVINGTTYLEDDPKKNEFEDKVVECFETKYDQFTSNISAVKNHVGNSEAPETNSSKFPTLIAIIGGCSFVAIVALLSTYFVSKRNINGNRVKIIVPKRKTRNDRNLVEVKDDMLDGDGHVINSGANIHNDKTDDLAKYNSDDSSLTISYGDSKLLNELARRPMHIDLKARPDEFNRLNASSKVELGISQGKVQDKGMNNSSINDNTKNDPKHDIRKQAARKYDSDTIFDESILGSSGQNEIDSNNMGSYGDTDRQRQINMQVLSPLARKYDVEPSFDEGAKKPSGQNKFGQNNMKTRPESVTGRTMIGTDYHDEYRNDVNRNNLRSYADSITAYSMADTEDHFASNKVEVDTHSEDGGTGIESIMESLNHMMDDMQSFMNEEGGNEQSLIERNESGEKSMTTAGSGTNYGLNIPSFALGEVGRVPQSTADEGHFHQTMNTLSNDTGAVDKNDCAGLSWLNLIDLEGKEKSNDSTDGESCEELLSVVASGDYGSSASGRSRFSRRFETSKA